MTSPWFATKNWSEAVLAGLVLKLTVQTKYMEKHRKMTWRGLDYFALAFSVGLVRMGGDKVAVIGVMPLVDNFIQYIGELRTAREMKEFYMRFNDMVQCPNLSRALSNPEAVVVEARKLGGIPLGTALPDSPVVCGYCDCCGRDERGFYKYDLTRTGQRQEPFTVPRSDKVEAVIYAES